MSTTDAPFPKAKPAAAHPLKSEALSSTSIPAPVAKSIESAATSPAGASLSLTNSGNNTVNPKNTVAQPKSSGAIKSPLATKAAKAPVKQAVKKAPEQQSKNDPALGNVVSISNTAVKELFSGADKVAKTVESTARNLNANVNAVSAKSSSTIAVGLETARKMAMQSADAITRVWGESVAIRQNHMDACTEAGTLAAEVANQLAENAMHFAQEAMAENVDISKSVFACRTASDVIALHNRLAQSNIQRFLNESARSSNLLFNFFSKVSEPFSETMAEAGKRVGKVLKN